MKKIDTTPAATGQLMLGNTDTEESSVWVPTTVPAEQQARLPSHEHVDALNSIETHAPRPYAYHDDTELQRDMRGERYALWAVCIFGSLALAVAVAGGVA